MTENRHIRRRIAWERKRAPMAYKLQFPSLLVAFFGLLAVALQSFVVQTHIHVRQPAFRTQALGPITLAATSVADPEVASSEA